MHCQLTLPPQIYIYIYLFIYLYRYIQFYNYIYVFKLIHLLQTTYNYTFFRMLSHTFLCYSICIYTSFCWSWEKEKHFFENKRGFGALYFRWFAMNLCSALLKDHECFWMPWNSQHTYMNQDHCAHSLPHSAIHRPTTWVIISIISSRCIHTAIRKNRYSKKSLKEIGKKTVSTHIYINVSTCFPILYSSFLGVATIKKISKKYHKHLCRMVTPHFRTKLGKMNHI